jgi:2-polyprenyl-6-hydroxyphenyl methylase/3-demethylubiquinone-9 3-methyltransferase
MISRTAHGLLKLSGLGVPTGTLEYKNGLYHLQIRRHIDLVDFIKENGIDRGGKVLDVGCGKGWLAQHLVNEGFTDVTGIDWLPTAEVNTDIMSAYHQADLNNAGLREFTDGGFECVICSDVLEHLENPASMLRELSRVTKKDGDIFVTIPNAFNIFERLRILFTGNSGRYNTEPPGSSGHISMFPDNVMKSLLVRARLQLVGTGKGYSVLAGTILLPSKKFGRFFSYVSYMHFRRSNQ